MNTKEQKKTLENKHILHKSM